MWWEKRNQSKCIITRTTVRASQSKSLSTWSFTIGPPVDRGGPFPPPPLCNYNHFREIMEQKAATQNKMRHLKTQGRQKRLNSNYPKRREHHQRRRRRHSWCFMTLWEQVKIREAAPTESTCWVRLWFMEKLDVLKVTTRPVKALKTPRSTYSNFGLWWITYFRSNIHLHVLKTRLLYVSMTPLYLVCGKILVECNKKKNVGSKELFCRFLIHPLYLSKISQTSYKQSSPKRHCQIC